jgi:hypothetical protein
MGDECFSCLARQFAVYDQRFAYRGTPALQRNLSMGTIYHYLVFWGEYDSSAQYH